MIYVIQSIDAISSHRCQDILIRDYCKCNTMVQLYVLQLYRLSFICLYIAITSPHINIPVTACTAAQLSPALQIHDTTLAPIMSRLQYYYCGTVHMLRASCWRAVGDVGYALSLSSHHKLLLTQPLRSHTSMPYGLAQERDSFVVAVDGLYSQPTKPLYPSSSSSARSGG